MTVKQEKECVQKKQKIVDKIKENCLKARHNFDLLNIVRFSIFTLFYFWLFYIVIKYI